MNATDKTSQSGEKLSFPKPCDGKAKKRKPHNPNFEPSRHLRELHEIE